MYWLPTVGKVTGMRETSRGVEVAIRSHTGKPASFEVTWASVADCNIGDYIFCHKSQCARVPSKEDAYKLLEQAV